MPKTNSKQLLTSPSYDLLSLSDDVLLTILKRSIPEDIASAAVVNHRLHTLATDAMLWKAKMACHFPSYFEVLEKASDVKWYEQFRAAYARQYAGLNLETRKFFSTLKENLFADLRAYFMGLDAPARATILSASDASGRTALHLAAEYGYVDALALLLPFVQNLGALKDNENATPLHLASKSGQVGAVNVLVDAVAPGLKAPNGAGNTAFDLVEAEAFEGLSDAVLADFESLARLLHEEDDEGKMALHLAAERGHVDVVQCITTLAMCLGKLEANEILHLDLGESLYYVITEPKTILNVLDLENKTPVHLAAAHGHIDVLNIFIALSADMNLLDVNDMSPAFLAARGGHQQVLERFQSVGVDLSARALEHRLTIAHIAACAGQDKLFAFFREQGIDVNAGDASGQTPAYYAVQHGHVHVLKALHALGVDLLQPDASGNTLYDAALEEGHWAVCAYLESLQFSLASPAAAPASTHGLFASAGSAAAAVDEAAADVEHSGSFSP